MLKRDRQSRRSVSLVWLSLSVYTFVYECVLFYMHTCTFEFTYAIAYISSCLLRGARRSVSVYIYIYSFYVCIHLHIHLHTHLNIFLSILIQRDEATSVFLARLALSLYLYINTHRLSFYIDTYTYQFTCVFAKDSLCILNLYAKERQEGKLVCLARLALSLSLYVCVSKRVFPFLYAYMCT